MFTKKSYMVVFRPKTKKRKEWSVYIDDIKELKEAKKIAFEKGLHIDNDVEVWLKKEKVTRVCV